MSRFPGLIIEITEDEVIRDTALLQEVAAQLKLLQCADFVRRLRDRIRIEARLIELSCVELKLDRSYVFANVLPIRSSTQSARRWSNFAHRVGSVVCAEGIDNPADLRSLMQMGCDTAQGLPAGKADAAETSLLRRSWPQR
jgi:EAL domain-containing protein (putative c-di-GMP-specific phosphodiesterase class I)